MSNCTNCGNPLDEASSTRCTRCGATVTSQSQGTRRSGYMATQQIAYPKETHVRAIPVPILAALSAIGGVEAILFAAKLNFNPKISELTSLGSSLGFLSSYMPYILGFAGVIALAATFGYMRRARWAWKLGIVSAVVSVFTIVAPNLIGFVLGLACLGLLFTHSIKSSLKRY